MVDTIEYSRLSTQVINMGAFDVMEENDITTKSGYIKKEPDDWEMGIQLNDRLRYALIREDSEFYTVFDEDFRDEFVFRLFKHISIGGGICQHDDDVNNYMAMTKGFYKDLTTVAKDSESGDVRVQSIVFDVKSIEKTNIFQEEGNPQNFFYVIVDPFHWHVTLMYHKWISFW